MPIDTCTIKGTDIIWTDLINATQEELMESSKKHSLNSFTLKDSMGPDHLPKFEEHNDIYFVIVRVYRMRLSRF